MGNSFKNAYGVLNQAKNSRHFGGTKYASGNMHISGNFNIVFVKLPNSLSRRLGISHRELKYILSYACTGVTPPTITYNKVQFPKQGGGKWSYPGSREISGSMNLKFVEFADTPIRKIFDTWGNILQSAYSGASDSGSDIRDLSGAAIYWTLAPDNKTVGYSAIYDGIFPSKELDEYFGSSIETIDKTEPEIELNVNNIYKGDWVDKFVAAIPPQSPDMRVWLTGVANSMGWYNWLSMGELIKIKNSKVKKSTFLGGSKK